jgi:hypothetical protein
MPDPTPNTVGPDSSWRLVHDNVYYYAWFESSGYTTSIHIIEEFATKAEGDARIAELGLVSIDPPVTMEPETPV